MIILQTEDGHHVATVVPQLPLDPGPVVFWGTRVFVAHYGDVWRETLPTVVIEAKEHRS